MTRVTDEPQPLEGAEFTRVRLEVSSAESGALETIQRLRRARSAWRVATALAEFLAEHPTP